MSNNKNVKSDFAQALARIEEISIILDGPTNPQTICKLQPELLELLDTHANSIVQLAKMAAEIRDTFSIVRDWEDDPKVDHIDRYELGKLAVAYDHLMGNGE